MYYIKLVYNWYIPRNKGWLCKQNSWNTAFDYSQLVKSPFRTVFDPRYILPQTKLQNIHVKKNKQDPLHFFEVTYPLPAGTFFESMIFRLSPGGVERYEKK